MERHELSRIAHRRHPIAAPVAPDQLSRLLSRLSPPETGEAVDLGCGEGEWLLALLEAHPGLHGVGLDLHLPAAIHARGRAAALADRLRWVEGDGAQWQEGPYDVVLCVGATHAFGGLDGTLDACRAMLRPGGQLVLGEGFWETPPTARTLEILGAEPDELPDLAGLVEQVQRHGLEPGYGHVSSAAEWDDYEWSWTGSLAEWGLRQAADRNDREQAVATAREHRAEWLTGYRGQLGFATLVLNLRS